jgi:uncharacterized protein YqjF (DUF2071 family)
VRLELEELIAAPGRQSAALDRTGHRPWPLPDRSWVLGQTWNDLLFAHWPVAAEPLRERLPTGLELDTWEGRAWLGITPFVLSGLRLRGTPPLPVVSRFPELNVRTYVSHAGRPGIWFLSLDAASGAAVEAARRAYRLPYHRARITVERRDEWIRYAAARNQTTGRPHVFEARYRPTAPPAEPHGGTLEHFLTERYCLYTTEDGHLARADIHHAPWQLQPAEAEIDLNTMTPYWLELPPEEPLLHFAARQDVVVWPLERALAA